MRTLKITVASLMAIFLSGCVTLDGFGGQITQAQAEVLKTRATMESDRLHYQAGIAREIAGIAQRTLDPVVQAWALSSIERIVGPQHAGQSQPQVVQSQDGPITSALKSLAPYVLPLAQLWVQREQGQNQIKFQTRQLATSVDLESMRLGLIDSIVGNIARDPLVVTTPAAPEPIIIPAPEPIIIYQPAG